MEKLSKGGFWKKSKKTIPIDKAIIIDGETFLKFDEIQIEKGSDENIYITIPYTLEGHDGTTHFISIKHNHAKISKEELKEVAEVLKKHTLDSKISDRKPVGIKTSMKLDKEWIGNCEYYYVNYHSDNKNAEPVWNIMPAKRIEGIGGRLHRTFEHFPAPTNKTYRNYIRRNNCQQEH